jgi:hypothetical protein
MLPKSKGAAEPTQLQLAVYQVASHIALAIASALDKLCRSLCNTLVKIQADLSCFSIKISDNSRIFRKSIYPNLDELSKKFVSTIFLSCLTWIALQ